MKLVIDIPEEAYKCVMDGTWCGSLYDELKNGVPVEPEKRTEERTETHARDCISRKAVMKLLEKEDWADTVYGVMNLPPVTPRQDIILCKNCKHWTNNIGNSELRDNYCNEEAHGFYYRCSGDDYCSFAERRTDE